MINTKSKSNAKSKSKTEEEIESIFEVDFCECIKVNNVIYTINQDVNESREVYLERVYYIISEINKISNIDNIDNINIDNIIRNSYIWRNIKFFGMTYPNKIVI